ncbi:hypothetical protein BC831DRAFT_434786 [Entophlyctis helioformis]|nr:hypothetical protein BC831DRAFT_434786 [Entophlyctis helioformis]
MSQSLTQPSQPEVHAEALTATQTSISSATTGTDDAALVKDTVPTKEPADGHQAKDTTETSAPIYSLAVPLSTLRENRETPAGDTIHIPTGDPDVRVSSGAAGRYHALVLASNGKVWSVGRVHPTGIMRCMSSTADDKDDDGDGDGDRDGDTEWMRDVRAVALDGKDIVQVACTDHASLLLDRQGRVYMVGCLKPSTPQQLTLAGTGWHTQDGDGRSFYAKSKELDSVLVRLPMPPKTPADTAITQLSTSSNRIWMVTKQGDVLSYGFGSLWGGTTTSVEAARSRKTPSGIPAARHIVFDTHCEPTGSEAKTGKDAASHGDGDGDGHGHGHSDDTAGQPRRRRKAHMTAITASDTRLELTDATGALWAVGALDPDTEIGAETGTAVTADKPIKLSMAGSAADQGASPTISSANDDPQPRAAGHAGLCARGTTDQRSFG